MVLPFHFTFQKRLTLRLCQHRRDSELPLHTIPSRKRVHRLESAQEFVVRYLAVAVFVEELHNGHDLVVGQGLLEKFIDALKAVDKLLRIDKATAG